MSREEAAGKLAAEIGGQNRIILLTGTDNEAYFSKRSIRKMISSTGDSMSNGFSFRQHYAVVADIVELYGNSFKLLTRGDSHGHRDVLIHRYGAPLYFGEAIAYITVKESAEHGKRVHNVELAEIKKLGGILTDEGIKYQRTVPAPSFHNDNIRDLTSIVKGRSDFF